ncbi:MAG: hypothetical protein U0V70_09755 [Terriglobia bacterium]
MTFTGLILLLTCFPFPEHSPSGFILRAADKNPFANSDPTYVQLRTALLSGESVGIEQFTLSRDRATITFISGQFFFLTPVAGKITGAVFIGQGEFKYSPPIDVERHQLSILTGSGSMEETFLKWFSALRIPLMKK